MECINLQMDGDQICATYSDFRNLQESPAGFGDSIKNAVIDLFEYEPNRCGAIQSTSNSEYLK